MNAEDVIKRMKEFGLKGVRDGSAHLFIKPDLLAEFVQSEILAEREACAMVCEGLITADNSGVREDSYRETAVRCAAAIRARSNSVLDGNDSA